MVRPKMRHAKQLRGLVSVRVWIQHDHALYKFRFHERRDASQSVTLMLALHRVFRSVTPKQYYAHLFRRGLATGPGLLGDLTSRGFIFQATK